MNVTSLAGFLLAKAAAAHARRNAKDWYDVAFVLLHNDSGGPTAAAAAVRARFGSELVGSIRTALDDLAANFQSPSAQGPQAYAAQMLLDHPELDQATVLCRRGGRRRRISHFACWQRMSPAGSTGWRASVGRRHALRRARRGSSVPERHRGSFLRIHAMTASPSAGMRAFPVRQSIAICGGEACHRVVGSNGSLTGYARGLECKRALLDLEAPEPAVAGRLFQPGHLTIALGATSSKM